MSSEANKKRSLSGNEQVLIFSDVSVDPKLKTGCGAYLAITEPELDIIEGMENSGGPDLVNSKLRIKQFEATSSTQLEIETILWALQELIQQQSIPALINNITLYTDSQGIIDLPRRRAALEQSAFISAAGRALNHAGLYRAFYQLQDQLGFKLVKLKGHSKRADKTRLDRVFAYVDKAARKALRALNPLK
jgi:ribonuclease HI